MSKIFFTSDLHFCHKKIIQYSNRPFKDIYQMNQKIINNWNEKISNDDQVYILGDYLWRIETDTTILNKITKKLNGKKHLIKGNHDNKYSNYQYLNAGFCSVSNIIQKKIKFNNNFYYFILFHYSLKFWDQSHNGSYCLYGHQHFRRDIDFELYKQLQMSTRTMNVCLDGNNLYPYSLQEILKEIQYNPINFSEK